MNQPPLPRFFRYAIPAGISLGLLWGLRTYIYFWNFQELEYFKWERHLWIHVVNYTTWALLLPLVYRSVVRIHFHQPPLQRMWLPLLLAGLVLSVLHEMISNLIFFPSLHLFGKEELGRHTLEHISRVLPTAVITRMVEFGIIYAILVAVEYQRRLRDKQIEMAQLESQLAGAQLNALRLQLQPHFLFNTLNTISSLMEFDVKAAQRVVSRLGSLLRKVLDKDKRNLTELREELAFIRNYLDIEQVRFQDRLRIEYQVEGEALKAAVPSLILQPLVENAVKHGFANRTDEGVIQVSARCENGRILLSVSDDGYSAQQSARPPEAGGIGLRNVRERLELIYKDDHQFRVQKGETRGFTVSIDIPYQKFPA